MAKKQKSTKKSANEKLHEADLKHYLDTEKYAGIVDKLYQQAITDLSGLASKMQDLPQDKSFAFKHNKKLEAEANRVVQQLASRIGAVIETGCRKEWDAACIKTEEYIKSVMDVSKLTKHTLQKYQDRNLEALAAFTLREVDGLDLSKRVWKHVAPIKDEVELAVDTSAKYYKHGINSGKTMTKIERAIGTGMSAAELSREVRSCLLEPNKLFRRVKDKYGNLTLSKAAKLYHPGQGVYRSSYKNAMRLTRSEINMAYRQSDHLRWQQLDFVVGMKVNLSNNHTTPDPKSKGKLQLIDICDELKGNYPKDFKFVGWHPQCRCYMTPILKTREEMNRDRQNADKPYYVQKESQNAVTETPEGFRQYIKDNDERIKGWSSTPYYIKDNPHYYDQALHPEKYLVNPLVLSADQTKRLADFQAYANAHQGSDKFAFALARAQKAMLAGNQGEFDEAMADMDSIMKKNENSTASKAAKKKAKNMSEQDIIAKMLADDLATFTPEQIANIKELEKLLKQKKGLRMTYEQANTGKENPKYSQPGETYWIKSGSKFVANPKLQPYHINCQTCVMAHEMRRRGFNVEALGNTKGYITDVVMRKNGITTRWGKYLNPDGTFAESSWVSKPRSEPGGHNPKYDFMTRKGYKQMSIERGLEFLKEATTTVGRYEVGVFWKGGGAHVICAERRADKTLVFFDPQSGKTISMDKNYLGRVILKNMRVLRVDDKIINPKLAEIFVPLGELPISATGKTRAEQIAEIAKKRHDARTDEQKKKLQDFWDKRKADGKAFRKEMADIINSAGNIYDAKQSLKDLQDLMLGNKGAITTAAGKTATASMEKMRDAVKAVKKNVDEFNAAMADAQKVAKELEGIKDIDTKTISKARNIAEIKKQQKMLEDAKKEIESLTYLDNPMQAAKDFSLADAKNVNNVVKKNLDTWMTKYGYKSIDENLTHAKAKLETEISLTQNSSSKYKTWKVAQDAYKKQLKDIEIKIEWESVKTAKAGFNIITAVTPEFTSLLGKLKAAIASNDLSAAKTLVAELKTWQAKLEQVSKKIADIDTYLATNKVTKIANAIAKAKAELAAGNMAAVDKHIADALLSKAKDEAKQAEKAKNAADKKAEKDYWADVKGKLKDIKKKFASTSKEWSLVTSLEDEIKTGNKVNVESLLSRLGYGKTKANMTKQTEEVTKAMAIKSGGSHGKIKKDCSVDDATARDYYDAVEGFSFQWDWEIRQVQMGNFSFTSHHGHTLAQIQKRANDIEKFIDDAPKWNGGTTYRGMSVSKETIEEWKKMKGTNMQIDMKGTASWSTEKSVSASFARAHLNETDALGHIQTERAMYECTQPQYGTSIQYLSHFPGEHEILCSKRCRWVITDYRYEGGMHIFTCTPLPVV